MAHKKKHKNKKVKTEGALAFVGAVLAQAIGQILGDAVEVAAERLGEAQKKASRALKKKKHKLEDGAVDSIRAVAP